jgi:hypothetical protein
MLLHKEKPSSPIFDTHYWPNPPSRNFSELSDPSLFAEVLMVANTQGKISLKKLISEAEGLGQRLRRLLLIERPTKTTIRGVLSALQNFGWLEEEKYSLGQYVLTSKGEKIITQVLNNDKQFRRILAEKMHKRYIIPGWLVARLLSLNPTGQGEIVLPSPLKQWQPSPRLWEHSKWSDDLTEEVIRSADRAREIFPGSFPINNEEWVREVKDAWNSLSALERRTVAKIDRRQVQKNEKPKISTFAPRGRLTQAMRVAAINLLFAETLPGTKIPDFRTGKKPITPRSFKAWCPRLDELEFIFYTDSIPSISGRLLVPCGAFLNTVPSPPFECLPEVSDPQGRKLWLYQPTWDFIKKNFLETLQDAYRRISQSVGSLYVSLLDVRDEVCRRLRLSSLLFDDLLETAYRETIRENLIGDRTLSISLESDIRQEQQSGQGLLRRPIYIKGVPHSLIAIASPYQIKRGAYYEQSIA